MVFILKRHPGKTGWRSFWQMESEKFKIESKWKIKFSYNTLVCNKYTYKEYYYMLKTQF
jgi:hypothetical protein